MTNKKKQTARTKKKNNRKKQRGGKIIPVSKPPCSQATIAAKKQCIPAPEAPSSWASNPDEWLSNVDIDKVMKQYETYFPYFEYLATSAIDFDESQQHHGGKTSCVEPELCALNLAEKYPHKTCFAAIFNLDDHTQPGSHWVAWFLDLRKKSAPYSFYFDSAANHQKYPRPIQTFVTRIKQQVEEELGMPPLKEWFNGTHVHQHGNSECGMYAIVFVTSLLTLTWKQQPVRFDDLKNLFLSGNITDEDMNDMRNAYFFIRTQTKGGARKKGVPRKADTLNNNNNSNNKKKVKFADTDSVRPPPIMATVSTSTTEDKNDNVDVTATAADADADADAAKPTISPSMISWLTSFLPIIRFRTHGNQEDGEGEGETEAAAAAAAAPTKKTITPSTELVQKETAHIHQLDLNGKKYVYTDVVNSHFNTHPIDDVDVFLELVSRPQLPNFVTKKVELTRAIRTKKKKPNAAAAAAATSSTAAAPAASAASAAAANKKKQTKA